MPEFDPTAVPCPWGTAPSLVAEHYLASLGFTAIAGIDEVGRGCLAGPVVTAAVILPLNETITQDLAGVRDSKMVSAAQRERLADRIRLHACCWSIGVMDVATIDTHNILQATRMAMVAAIAACTISPTALLLDAIKLPTVTLPQVSLIKGDQRSLSIAVASIIAKVTRDQMMRDYERDYPDYGFARHKGYGTPYHLNALKNHGPTPIHRASFAPVKALLTLRPTQATVLSDSK